MGYKSPQRVASGVKQLQERIIFYVRTQIYADKPDFRYTELTDESIRIFYMCVRLSIYGPPKVKTYKKYIYSTQINTN